MNAHRLLLPAALAAICFSPGAIFAQAQRRAPSSAAVTTAPRASTARPTAVRAGTSARPVARGSGVVLRNQSHLSPEGFFGAGGARTFGGLTPGLGFNNFGNFSAANQDLWIKAAIDPATQWRLFERQRFHGDAGFGAGFYLLDGGYYEPYAPPADAETQQQVPPEEQQGGATESESAETTPAEQPASETAAPVEDVGQFVLVLRNGTQIQTVAFTRRNDRIVYVTVDGLRRTLAVTDLDTGATNRINEERGTPLQSQL